MMQCEACGYSNSDLYRFCGQCGRALAPVTVPAKSEVAAHAPRHTVSVSGPSLLGLDSTSQTDDNPAYLLEDEPPSHRGAFTLLFIMIILFCAAAAFVGYQKYYFVAPLAGHVPAPTPPAFAYDRTPDAVWEQAKTMSLLDQPVLPGHSLSDRLALENISASVRNLKAREKLAAETDTAPDAGARQLAEGEKYLYGRGVVANCKYAVKNFEDAAANGNAKAMAHLGSLYGSGRCVKFNRTTAYDWFTKAKNADPDNPWIESSMDMLWRNMTRKERSAFMN